MSLPGETAEPDSGWVRVPISLPEPGQGAPFQVGDLELLLCNVDGVAYVIRDQCPHANTSLRGGTLRGSVLACPLHGGELDVRDGSAVSMPIRRPVTCYPVRPAEGGWQVALPVGVS